MNQQGPGRAATTLSLEGKTALVTGAGSGIGYAIATRFAEAGAQVVINYFGYEAEARELAAKLPKAIALKADVSNAEQVGQMFAAAKEHFGSVHVLVNNAGIEKATPILDIAEADWDQTLAVNLKGPFLCIQAAGRLMRDGGHPGSIVNISSIHEDATFPGYTPYAASKGGMRMLMRNAALELAQHQIRVNNIAPGAIATPINDATLHDPAKVEALQTIIPLGRLGQPQDIAELALFLASDSSAYVTGSTYYVDGGMVRYAQAL